MFNGGVTHNHHLPEIETDPFLKNYSASDLQTASEFLLIWLPFLSKGLCHHCSLSISNRVRSLVPQYDTEQSNQETEEQVSTPSHRDSKHETDINDTKDTNSLGSWKDGVNGASGASEQVSTPSNRDSKHETDIDDTEDTNSLGSWKDGVNGASEQIVEACRTEMLQLPEHAKSSTPRMSWADMAQEELEADEEEEARLQFGNFSSKVEEVGEVKVTPKSKLSTEQRERIRFGNVIRKKDFACFERINGKLVNIVDGLELHSNVFSSKEQRKIVDFVFELQEKGQNGKLKARTYTAPQKWMRGKGRVTIQFGCCYNYATDRNGNPPGILHNMLVDPIPPLFKVIIKRLVTWHILPPTCVPDSCIVNIYDEGDCIPPHIDNHDFLRPFCTVSFLSECNILFGTNLKIEGPGEFSGSFPIPLPMGSVLVLNGNGADVAKHCVPAVPTKRISITFRKMDESKWPIGFVPEPDLQGLEPLPYESDKPKVNSNLSKPSQPSNRQTVGGIDTNISKPSQQLYGQAVRRYDTMENQRGLLGQQPRFYGQSQIKRQQGPSPGFQRKARLEY